MSQQILLTSIKSDILQSYFDHCVGYISSRMCYILLNLCQPCFQFILLCLCIPAPLCQLHRLFIRERWFLQFFSLMLFFWINVTRFVRMTQSVTITAITTVTAITAAYLQVAPVQGLGVLWSVVQASALRVLKVIKVTWEQQNDVFTK